MDENRQFFNMFVAFITAVHQATTDFAIEVRPEGITPVQYSILQYIAVNPPVTLSGISECMHLSMPNASRELKKLIGKELCIKEADANDRRKQFIRLAPKGEEMMKEVFGRLQVQLEKQMEGIGPEERRELSGALQLLMSKLFKVIPPDSERY